MDVAHATLRYLLDVPGPAARAVDFRIYRYRLGAPVAGTGNGAVVLRPAGGYLPSNRHNTMRASKLAFELYQDSSDDLRDAEARADAVWRQFDAVLHRPLGFHEKWGDAQVMSTHRLGEYELFPVTESDSTVLLVCEYGVMLV